MGIKTLVSAKNLQEVDIIIRENPDILDLKNPLEGSLGAPIIPLIHEVKDRINSFRKNGKKPIEFSVAIGDFPYLPGTASMAAFGVAHLDVDYIKVGLLGPKTKEEGIVLSRSIVDAVHEYDHKIKIVIVGYADQREIGASIDPLIIPEITSSSGACIAMLDTKQKNGKSLFTHLSMDELHLFVDKCRSQGIGIALAGSLNFKDLNSINKLQPDIVGVRSMVCEQFDRLHGEMQPDLIRKLKTTVLSELID
ncbi:MAG: (5-formylfuran-3-yl)methyl phosphate synthase [Candidatus Lokiarchaeota archaeon]|nr:(5-formylfuran-3-yl)methyl phosphate synthase [Candidatus Lokiarchaeota archaeon]